MINVLRAANKRQRKSTVYTLCIRTPYVLIILVLKIVQVHVTILNISKTLLDDWQNRSWLEATDTD